MLQRHRKVRSQAFLEKVLSICFSFPQAQISRGPKHKQKKKKKEKKKELKSKVQINMTRLFRERG